MDFALNTGKLVMLSKDNASGAPYSHYLEISAKSISIGDIKHDNHW